MQHVWIDSDMGFDDLAAVLTVAHTPGWTIDGLSLVAGNAPLEVVTGNALRSAACFGWVFPIHAGCAAPLLGPLVTAQNILGGDAMRSAGRQLPPQRGTLAHKPAVDVLRDYLQNAQQPATLLALGPLTNLATLLQQSPQLAGRVGQLVWMGGSETAGNHTAAAEFNAAVDPEAVQAVLDAKLPLQMVGLDACRQVQVSAADCQHLRQVGTEKAHLLADLLLGYVQIAAAAGTDSMALYDPSAAAAMLRPASVAMQPAHIAMELVGTHTRGMTVVERRVPRRATANAMVACAVDAQAVRTTVLNALCRAAAA